MAARGIIISLSLLFAAGLAVYENPQVREWIDQHRQKIAVTLQGWGEDGMPPSTQRRREASRDFDDASTKEDDSPEATERRKQLREELAERRRILSEKSGRSTPHLRRGSSFDDMVDSDGKLKASTTGAMTNAGDAALRRRGAGAAGVAAGSAFANPFGDEMSFDSADEHATSDEELARQLQATFDREAQEAADGPISPLDDPLTDEELAQFKKHVTLFDNVDRTSQVQNESSRPQALTQRELQEFQNLLEAETGRSGVEEMRHGTHGISEQELLQHLRELEGPLVDLDESGRRTPTATTTAPSTHTYPHTPGTGSEVLIDVADATSTHPSEPALLDLTPTTSAPGTPRQLPRQPVHQASYQSIQDWAEQSTASFHSLPDEPEHIAQSRVVSPLSSVRAPSERDSEVDLVSDPGISTPGTWTEVGSVVSADDHHQQQH